MVCAIYPNVGHKICMLNEKNDEDKNIKVEKKFVINNKRK
jgi:hypothetical protein